MTSWHQCKLMVIDHYMTIDHYISLWFNVTSDRVAGKSTTELQAKSFHYASQNTTRLGKILDLGSCWNIHITSFWNQCKLMVNILV